MIEKEKTTKNYYNEDHFQMSYKRLTMASYWVDPFTGENVKLTHNLKAVYTYKLEQYHSFKKKGLIYHESHQRVADMLSLDYDTVRKVIIPILKRMGLITIDKINTRLYDTTVYPIGFLVGELVNEKLHKRLKKASKEYKKDPITYEELKIIERNNQRLKKVKENIKEEYFLFTREDMERLRGRKG